MTKYVSLDLSDIAACYRDRAAAGDGRATSRRTRVQRGCSALTPDLTPGGEMKHTILYTMTRIYIAELWLESQR